MKTFSGMTAMAAPFAALLLAACQTPASLDVSSAPAGAVTAVENNEIILRPGQKLWIGLPSNGSTGYAWRIKPFDEAVLKPGEPFGQEARAPQGNPPVVGASGETQWLFTAGAPGSVSLELAYSRPWDTSTPPTRIVHYAVTVR